jgi:hypothetical protein
VTEVIGKHCRAETRGQRDAAIVGRAIFHWLRLLLSILLLLAVLLCALVLRSF